MRSIKVRDFESTPGSYIVAGQILRELAHVEDARTWAAYRFRR